MNIEYRQRALSSGIFLFNITLIAITQRHVVKLEQSTDLNTQTKIKLVTSNCYKKRKNKNPPLINQ